MKVLMVTGDKNLLVAGTNAHERLGLQRGVVEELAVMYIGWESVSWRMWPTVLQKKFDVVTSQDPFLRGLFALYISRALKARLNVQVHADIFSQSSVRQLLARFVLRRADSVRVVSEKVRQQVVNFGVNKPVHVLPVFVDIARFRAVKHEPHEQKTILWIGRFEDEKNPLEAISILAQVRKMGIDAKLVMLGTGSLLGQLQQEVGVLPVEFPGWQDPAEYLGFADVVLCTSKNESWGASIIEALAAGIPVVAPDVGVAREAGAIVVSREGLAETVCDVLQTNSITTLELSLLEKPEEWANAWKGSLI